MAGKAILFAQIVPDYTAESRNFHKHFCAFGKELKKRLPVFQGILSCRKQGEKLSLGLCYVGSCDPVLLFFPPFGRKCDTWNWEDTNDLSSPIGPSRQCGPPIQSPVQQVHRFSSLLQVSPLRYSSCAWVVMVECGQASCPILFVTGRVSSLGERRVSALRSRMSSCSVP